MIPPNGDKPIEVLTHLPPLIAVIDAPEPKCKVMRLKIFSHNIYKNKLKMSLKD
jgi:hypothetical protein